MAIGDIYLVTVDINIENQRTTSNWAFREKVATTDPIPANALITALQATVISPLTDMLSAQALITSMYARRVLPSPGIPGQDLISVVNGQGGRSANCCPPQATMIISLYTATASGRGRGRIMISGIAEEDQDTGQITDLQLVRIEAFMTAMRSTIPASGADPGEWELAVYSPSDGAGRAVVHHVVRSSLGAIRSRRAVYGPGGTGT